MSKHIPNLVDRDRCTGCGACRNACPVSAIKMLADEEGFAQPTVDMSICIECKKCESVCPALHLGRHRPIQLSDKPIKCGLIRDENIWRDSSSGGAFTGICSVFADGNAVVYGARFADVSHVAHARVEGVANMAGFRKSKYVQSDIGNTFKLAKDDLEHGRQVIFSGTPCQIAGLREYLGRDYNELLCVEFICHGVGSPKVFAACLSDYERKTKRKLVEYAFRTKLSWPNKSVRSSAFSSAYICSDGKIMEVGGDVYNRLFRKQLILRRSCMENCKYRMPERYADITIADARKEREINPDIKDDKNRSVIIANTIKGEGIVARLDHVMELLPYTMDMLAKTNPLYFGTTKGSRQRTDFFTQFAANESLDKIASCLAPKVLDGWGAQMRRIKSKLRSLAMRMVKI